MIKGAAREMARAGSGPLQRNNLTKTKVCVLSQNVLNFPVQLKINSLGCRQIVMDFFWNINGIKMVTIYWRKG